MGKRERHAVKKNEIEELAASRAPLRAPVAGLGFIKGWGWGWQALKLALRHPFYFGLGYLMLALSLAILVVAAAWVPSASIAIGPIAVVGAIMGVACLGRATCAIAAKPKGGAVPWRAWIEPLASWASAGKLALRSAALFVVLMGFAAWGEWAQRKVVAGGFSPEALNASMPLSIRILSFVMLFAFATWLLAASAPAMKPMAWMKVFLSAALSPMTMLGIGLFWLVWVVVCEFILSFALAAAASAAAGSLPGAVIGTPDQMFVFASMVMIALSAPLIAMSMGLASQAIQLRLQSLEEEKAWLAKEIEALKNRVFADGEKAER